MINPVEKGKAYEEQVVEYLNTHGLDAHRTNVTNPDDPVEYNTLQFITETKHATYANC